MKADEIITRLLGKKPYLEPYFAHNSRSLSKFFTENAKNGKKIICTEINGEKIRLSSIHDPEREALRCIPEESKNWQASHIIIITGLGNPLLLKCVSEILKPDQICIAIDAHFELGIFLCNHFPETIEFLSKPGSHMFCGEEMQEGLMTYLESLPRDKLKGIRIIAHQPSLKLNPEYYRTIEEIIHISFKSKISDLLTRFEFEKIWIRNILANSIYFSEKKTDGSPSPENLLYFQGILKGIPALLVSAGPSLRHSIPLIKKLSGKCFILACDTSIKVLEKSGIEYHAAITLDAQKHSIFHFQGIDLSNRILFADIVCNPELLAMANPGKVIFSTTARFAHSFDGKISREATPGTEYIEAFHGTLASIQSGGSVATSGYDLLRFLGAGQIFLIGQDLAYTGREIHSTGTHHNEKWLGLVNRTQSLESINERIIRKRETFYVPAITGKTILTDYVLNLYRNWFEQSIPECKIPTWNLSADGATIQGASSPADIEFFAASLPPVMDIDSLFGDAGGLKIHRINQDNVFYNDLKKIISDEIFDKEFIFRKYPFTRPLIRKTDIYIKRNLDRLNQDQSESLYGKNIEKLLRELERGLRPYFL